MNNPISFTNSKNVTYYLHDKQIMLRGNRPQRIFYFAKQIGENVLTELPTGYEIVEGKSGLVFLRRIKAN